MSELQSPISVGDTYEWATGEEVEVKDIFIREDGETQVRVSDELEDTDRDLLVDADDIVSELLAGNLVQA